MTRNVYTQFLEDPDQAARWAELATFIGPNADKFKPAYEALRERTLPSAGQPKRSIFAISICWPAVFLGPVWLVYRKLYVWALGLLALGVALSFIPGLPHLGAVLGVAIGASGKQLYVTHAIKQVSRLRAEAPERIAAAGGVALGAALAVAVVLVGCTVLYAVSFTAHPAQ